MRVVSEHDLARVLTYPALVAALHDAFRRDINVPLRHHHAIAQPGGDATLLLMPAWTEGGERFLGCKIVTVFPGNAAIGKPSVYANYILLSGDTGEPLAVIEGRALTARRTAAASALAAGFLARPDAEHLVMIGAGALAAHLVRAHGAVRPIRRVTLWNRTRARGEVLAAELTSDGIAVTLTDELEAAIRTADIISCATLSAEALVRGAWLKPGAHVDLVGGYTPQMREADDEAVRRARVYVDTRAGALHEAGDVVDPIRRGVISEADIAGDLFDLCRGTAAGRRTPDEITLFKSVGTALEDLAAAMLVWRQMR
jgi:ornithine cyclodeaminase/alanine dehydrogenase-like protein (mu-crystallin family)